jgi:hypothetical protein
MAAPWLVRAATPWLEHRRQLPPQHGKPRELEVEDELEAIVVILKNEMLKMKWMAKT